MSKVIGSEKDGDGAVVVILQQTFCGEILPQKVCLVKARVFVKYIKELQK